MYKLQDVLCPSCKKVNPELEIYSNNSTTCKLCDTTFFITNNKPGGITLTRDPLLIERQKTHGDFALNAQISQSLKSTFRAYMPVEKEYMKHVHKEALDMIALKLSRILSGQANFKDHWDDIAGYAKLASEACQKS